MSNKSLPNFASASFLNPFMHAEQISEKSISLKKQLKNYVQTYISASLQRNFISSNV